MRSNVYERPCKNVMKITSVALTSDQQQTVQEEIGDSMIHWACMRRNEVRDELHDKILFLEAREGYSEKETACNGSAGSTVTSH